MQTEALERVRDYLLEQLKIIDEDQKRYAEKEDWIRWDRAQSEGCGYARALAQIKLEIQQISNLRHSKNNRPDGGTKTIGAAPQQQGTGYHQRI